MLILVLNYHVKLTIFALYLVEIALGQVLFDILSEDTHFSYILRISSFFLNAVERALVMLEQTLSQVLQCFIITHIFPSTHLVMPAIQF